MSNNSYQIFDRNKMKLITINIPTKTVARFDSKLTSYNIIHNTTYDFTDIIHNFTNVELLCDKYSNNATISSCLCGHSIHNLYTVSNPQNQHAIMMGGNCIKKYIINAKQICKDCKITFKFTIGNITCKECTKRKNNATKDYLARTRPLSSIYNN